MESSNDFLWFPFLRYQNKCNSEGKETSITDWLMLNGKLEQQENYIKAKSESDNLKKAQEMDSNLKATIESEDKIAAAVSVKSQ